MRKRLLPKPTLPPEGYMINPIDIKMPGFPRVNELIPVDFMNYVARESITNWNEEERNGYDCGMPRWNKDPSYNWRRKNGRRTST